MKDFKKKAFSYVTFGKIFGHLFVVMEPKILPPSPAFVLITTAISLIFSACATAAAFSADSL